MSRVGLRYVVYRIGPRTLPWGTEASTRGREFPTLTNPKGAVLNIGLKGKIIGAGKDMFQLKQQSRTNACATSRETPPQYCFRSREEEMMSIYEDNTGQ
jgi:hypothetical protein